MKREEGKEVQRDAQGFPIEFELDIATAMAWESEVKRLRELKWKEKGKKPWSK